MSNTNTKLNIMKLDKDLNTLWGRQIGIQLEDIAAEYSQDLNTYIILSKLSASSDY